MAMNVVMKTGSTGISVVFLLETHKSLSQQARNVKRAETRPEATKCKTAEPSLSLREIWMSGLISRKYSICILLATSVALKPPPTYQ